MKITITKIGQVIYSVDNQGRYFSNIGLERSEYLNDKSIEALADSDYLHLEENQPSYNENNDNFGLIVEDIIDLMHVQAKDNTVLRLKEVEVPALAKYRKATGRERPVIYSRGLWSNLFQWKDFAEDMGIQLPHRAAGCSADGQFDACTLYL
ncbi:MAG TPA: hypothetical protein VJJ75_00555 [Candidatus Nanoarchaeia archaeon]|nr:hypothetical protein [Candidatus Nanoarchaeia archaeon]